MRSKDCEKIAVLEKQINDYFYDCDSQNAKILAEDNKIKKPYTVSGLLCKLEMTKDELRKYIAKPNFKRLFENALARIEAFTEEYALTGALSASAAANTLKFNFGWNDTKHKDEDAGVEKSIKIILDGDLVRLAE